MPCQSDYGDEIYYKSKCDQLTRMLCDVCKKAESITDHEWLFTSELRAWWDDHKKADAERNAREDAKAEENRKKRVALDKLTHDEMKLLGII